jgi:isopropylmalate/homocitrate/citramalate synthase
MNLTAEQIRRIEEQLNDVGYNNVEFCTIDEHPDTDVKMVWFKQDNPRARYQYVLARLDFSASNPPYLDIIDA